MLLYLIRHGQSVGNVQGVLQGRLDLPLTEAGHAQARAIGTRLAGLPLDVIFSSPQQRAAETAAAVMAAQLARGRTPALIRDLRLCEQFMGSREGVRLDALRADEQARGVISLQASDEANHDGETAGEVRARMRSFIDERLLTAPHAQVALVGHGNALGLLLCELIDVRPQAHHPFAFSNASLASVRREGRHWRLQTLGDVGHL
jgi:2,3-bisphosphoglycerate-dependent phosphoglycerate mutase